MKPEEAIRALAFLSNPDELTMAPDSSLVDVVRDDSFEGGFHGSLRMGLSKLLSEKSLDLYSMIDKGNSTSTSNNQTIPDAASKNHLPGTASTTSPESNSTEPERGVCFGTVEVRKYPVTIGCNPSVSRGVPRTIEWDHLEDETERHHINAYERDRPNDDRRRGEELLLDGITRARMLRDLGFTKSELLEGIRRAKEHLRGGGRWKQKQQQQPQQQHNPASARMGSNR
jgi:hypothetical protein